MLLLLDCSVVFVVVLAFASVVVFVGDFCASACFFASRAKRLRSASLFQKQHGQGFWLLLASFLEHRK